MIIDFHTHIFPERIAERTIATLSKMGGISPYSDGTADGLVSSMERSGVDISVVLPVLTSPSQFDSVIRFAEEINAEYSEKKKRILSFAGIHPKCEDIEEKMERIKSSGFLGVKIHPDYQGTYVDDDGYVKILECAKKHDLIVVTHAGFDFGFPNEPVKCTPDRVLKLLKKVPYGKLVLAHFGGNEMFDEVYEKLAGLDIYFDTSYVLRYIDKSVFLKILEKHGEDKILFATDSPWSNAEIDLKIIKSYGLSNSTLNKIFSENAKGLLRI